MVPLDSNPEALLVTMPAPKLPRVTAPEPVVKVLLPVTDTLPLKVPPTAVRLPEASILASTVPPEFCSCNRSAPLPGVAPPLITATGVVAEAAA
jgi:hypothetical protein